MKWDQDVAGAIEKYRGGPWDDAIDELLDAPLIEVGGVIRFRADGGSIVAGRIGRVATLFDGWLNTDLTGWEIKEEADLRLEFSDEVFVFLDWLEEQGEPISQWLRNDAAYAINREDVIQWRRRQMVASCDVSIGQSFGCVYSTEFTGSCVIVWLFEGHSSLSTSTTSTTMMNEDLDDEISLEARDARDWIRDWQYGDPL